MTQPKKTAPLDADERLRYSRQIILPDMGEAGQETLKASSVLLVGAGGLGSPLALYLAAAGVGRIGLADFDTVDASNLHRQVLHANDSVGRSKLLSAQETIHRLNPRVQTLLHDTALSAANALDILRPYDVVADGADNFAARYLINDACVLLGKPDVSGSVFMFEGQIGVFWARHGPCYRCLYPEPPPPGAVPSCGEAGVLGVLPGVVGLWQATETIKLLLGIGQSLIGRIWLYDALAMRVREVRVAKDPACAICGPQPSIRTLTDLPGYCGTPTAGPASADEEIEAVELQSRIEKQTVFVLDVRQPEEWEQGRIPGAVLIPLDTLPERLSEIPADRETVAYCRSGVRSLQALRLLKKSGRTNVRHLKNGFVAWRAATQ